MTEHYETATFGGTGRNVERLGTFVAWLVSNNLMEPVLERTADTAIARVKMQDLTGPEFLTTVLHGELLRAHVSDQAHAFMASYFVTGQYQADYETCEYDGDNEWFRYDRVAPKISAAFQDFLGNKQQSAAPRKRGAKVIQFRPRGR